MPCRVSGVTTAPSDVPIRTKIARISWVGIRSGRPANDEPATAKIEPDSQPAGTPTRPSAAPPAAAVTSVSARWRAVSKRLSGDGADKMETFTAGRAHSCAATHPARSMPRGDARVKSSPGEEKPSIYIALFDICGDGMPARRLARRTPRVFADAVER